MVKYYFLIFCFCIILVSGLSSCGEQKEQPENLTEKYSKEELSKVLKEVPSGDYVSTGLPAAVGYLSDKKGIIRKLISHEMKQDSKSKYIAVMYETSDASIETINVHFEGEYNGNKLSWNHPYIFICEKFEDCNNCSFSVSSEGTVCGCMVAEKNSPCFLNTDYISEYDFYDKYFDTGKNILTRLNSGE